MRGEAEFILVFQGYIYKRPDRAPHLIESGESKALFNGIFAVLYQKYLLHSKTRRQMFIQLGVIMNRAAIILCVQVLSEHKL